MQEILRSKREPVTVRFGTTLEDSGLIAMGVSSAFSFMVPADMGGVATISFFGAATSDGAFQPIYLSDGTRAEMQVGANRIHVAFPELFSIPLLKATSSVAFDATILAKG